MKKTKFLLVTLTLILSIHTNISAQEFKGIVYELESSNTIWNVTVKNLRTKAEVNTDQEGKYRIGAQLNDYLEFEIPGYQKDTLFLYEEGLKRIYMLREDNSIVIDEVLVTRLTDSRLQVEIERAENDGKSIDINQRRGGFRVSPSRVFGKKAKDARNNLALLQTEQSNRKVDRKFTNQLISSIVPLSEEEVALFKERFRPTVKFIEIASPQDLQIYILDAYKKFKGDQ